MWRRIVNAWRVMALGRYALTTMRFFQLALIPTCLMAACIQRRPVPSSTATPAEASPTPVMGNGAPQAAAIHDVSEVSPPPVGTRSEPVPGFMRGINLGNALDAPIEGAWGVKLEKAHFTMAKAAGLDHVRLPVRFSAHADKKPPYAVESDIFDRIDWAIERAHDNGLSLIIDLHHYEELMKKPSDHADRLVAIWKQIAEHFENAPPTVAFELINEPCDQLTSSVLNPITQRALAAVRATNPTRLVFVDSFFWAAADRLKELELPQDPNLVPSFHHYQPILFTHQGMPFMAPEFQTRPVVFPGPPAAPVTPVAAGQKTDWVNTWFTSYNSAPIAANANGPKAVFDYFQIVEEYVKNTKRRVYMGEWGVSINADPKSRESWIRLVRQEAEKRHIGWAIWDDGGAFRAMNVRQGTWVAPIEAGLFH